MRGKPYVISVDDNLAFYNTSYYEYDYGGGGPVFAYLSKDNRNIWGAVLEKAYAKLIGTYGRLSGGFLENGIRSLTGAPIISYETSVLKSEDKVFDLLKAADSANYIITSNSFLKQ
jgi:calpain-15